jgi:hypothetical protein
MITRKLWIANPVEAAENIADKRNQGLRLEIDNSAAERTLRAVALGRKNYLFAGSDCAVDVLPPSTA